MDTYAYTPFILPLVVTAVLAVGLLVMAWQNRAEPAAVWFAATLVCLMGWTLGYMLELMAVGLQTKVFWADLQYVFIAALPLAWLQMVLVYRGGPRLPRALWVVLLVLSASSAVAAFVNPGHLFRVSPTVVVSGSLVALHPDYGALWRYLWVPYNYVLFAAIIWFIVRSMTHAQTIYVRQFTALLIATLVPLAAGTLYAAGLSPWPDYNPAMAVLSVCGLLMAYALFHYRLFDIAPLARDAVIDNLADGLVVIDVEGRLRDFNRAARQVFPMLGDAALGRPVDEVLAIHPAMLAGLREEARAGLGHNGNGNGAGPISADVSVTVPGEEGGRVLNFALQLSAVRTRSGRVRGHALLLHDVTESVALMARLEQLAERDELTGLLSRRVWHEEAEKELMRARRYGYGLSVTLLDLDDLGTVNERFGFAVGDAVLKEASARLRRIARPFDLIGRMGSDEFAVLAPHLLERESLAAARKLCAALEEYVLELDSGVVRASACAGVASVTDLRDESPSVLLNRAEHALRSARAAGPGSVRSFSSG
jgi:diguanylate cyclase (GGDEF)-like protein/PAS domain S-box-containing protein